MRAKLLLMLFLVSLSLGAFASERRKRLRVCSKVQNKVMTRIPFETSIQAEDINDRLYLTFQFSLNGVHIVILDGEGNEVLKEQQTIIYEGRTIFISNADSYPYSIEIISPTVNILGEIALEE